MTATTKPVWRWQGGNLWHLVATDPARDETFVLATAASTYWHIPGTNLDGAARDCEDARRRAIRALVRAGMLPELPDEPNLANAARTQATQDVRWLNPGG